MVKRLLKNRRKVFLCKIACAVLITVLFVNINSGFAGNNLDNGQREEMLKEINSLYDSAHSLERALELVSELIKPSVVSITAIKVMKHPPIPFQRRKNQYSPYGDPRGNPHGNPHGGNPHGNPRGGKKRQGRGQQDFFDFFGGGEFFDKFFRDKFPDREFRQQGLGSGVIVDKEGYILTNNHVVEDADEIKVILGDKREFDGKVIGTDPQSDVAVIKIEGENLLPARLGNSDALRVGNWAIAIGNPFGLTQTVSFGVVSATGRADIGIAQYEDMIQTDAAINPGNSGGPLVNIKGEVIGINTAIFSKSGGYQGIGFAIPINMAKINMNSLIKHGRVTRGWLGVVIQDLTPALIKQFNVSSNEGVLIADVQKESPASEANMKTGDVIVKFNEKDVTDVNHLRNIVAQTEVGKVVSVIVLRNGKEEKLSVKIQEQPSDLFVAAGSSPKAKDLGMAVQDLTPELAKSLGIDEMSGVVVTEVVPGSAAEDAQLMQGDLIKEVNRKKVKNVEEFKSAIKISKGDEEVLFLVKRGDYTRYVILKEKE